MSELSHPRLKKDLRYLAYLGLKFCRLVLVHDTLDNFPPTSKIVRLNIEIGSKRNKGYLVRFVETVLKKMPQPRSVLSAVEKFGWI